MEPGNLPRGMDVGSPPPNLRRIGAELPQRLSHCELEIDEETGTVDIQSYTVVDDVGTVIIRLAQRSDRRRRRPGRGAFLMEDIRFDGEGQMLTGSFIGLRMPRADSLSAVEVVATRSRRRHRLREGRRRSRLRRRDAAVANALVDAPRPGRPPY